MAYRRAKTVPSETKPEILRRPPMAWLHTAGIVYQRSAPAPEPTSMHGRLLTVRGKEKKVRWQ